LLDFALQCAALMELVDEDSAISAALEELDGHAEAESATFDS
jgi:hypothetical protein